MQHYYYCCHSTSHIACIYRIHTYIHSTPLPCIIPIQNHAIGLKFWSADVPLTKAATYWKIVIEGLNYYPQRRVKTVAVQCTVKRRLENERATNCCNEALNCPEIFINQRVGDNVAWWLIMHHVSGDADSVVPVTSTRYSINALKLPIKVPWYAWYHREQVHCHDEYPPELNLGFRV